MQTQFTFNDAPQQYDSGEAYSWASGAEQMKAAIIAYLEREGRSEIAAEIAVEFSTD